MRLLSFFVAAFFVGTISWVVALKYINPSKTYLMSFRKRQAALEQRTFSTHATWLDLDHIPKALQEAIVYAEDSDFYKHHGIVFDKFVLATKMYLHRKKGQKLFGFSTITQQTAKNVFLYPHRTPLRKALEVYFVPLMELVWGKKRILEMYLNIIEFGDGIYGVEAASLHYFKKSCSDLSIKEAYWLASIMSSPRKLAPNRRIINPILRMRADSLSQSPLERHR